MNLNQLIRHAADLQDQFASLRDSINMMEVRMADKQQKLDAKKAAKDDIQAQYQAAKLEIKALLATE